jgi:hypothetical protein
LHEGNFAHRWEVEEDRQVAQRLQLSPPWLEALAELDIGYWPDGSGG